MYYEHFGLNRPPFRITPDPSLFFSGAERGTVLEALTYVVLSGESITKVIGEVGSGKTMLCRMLEQRLPGQVITLYIANPNVAPEYILNIVAFEAGFEDPPQDRLELMQLLHQWLLDNHAANRRVVVLIEEAQGMPTETLEEIRLLSNLETDREKLLQIVLFGQPELDEKLARREIRQLQDRIAHHFYLGPLNAGQIREYTNFRVRQAGYRGPDLFDSTVCRRIERTSSGLIRRINILADKTLLAAYSEGTTRLSPRHVRIAWGDSRFTARRGRSARAAWLAAAAGMAAGAALAGVLAWKWRPVETGGDTGPVPPPGQVSAGAAGAAEPAGDRFARHRLAARDWLKEAAPDEYSIQLMIVKTAAAGKLSQYLKGLPKSIDLNDIFIYDTVIEGEPMLGVLYQRFASRDTALERLRNMPAAFKSVEPFLLRSAGGLRREIADTGRRP